MTISTEPTALTYNGDGLTTSFPITWKYFAKSHVVATRRDSNDVELVWVLGTHYTLTDAGVDSGGTLTATTALASGEKLVINLNPPNVQDSSLPLGGPFPSPTVEDGLDLSAQRDGKIEELLNRAFLVPKTDTQTGSSLNIPIDSDRKGKFFAFDAVGAPSASAGTGNDSALRTDLADTANGGLLVAFKFSGTGSVARTVHSRLNDTINVKDFGATGDGTTDDSVSIQSAIAYAESVPGMRIDVDPGAYNLGTTGITILGDGIILHGNSPRFVGAALFGVEFLYSGTGAAVAFGSSAKVAHFRNAINNIQVRATGAAITSSTASGVRVINQHYFDSGDLATKGFKSGRGLYLLGQGAGGFGAITQFRAFCSHECNRAISTDGAGGGIGQGTTQFFGGTVIAETSGGSPIVGTVGLDLEQYSNGFSFFGMNIENYAKGAVIVGGAHKFFGCRTEFNTLSFEIQAAAARTEMYGTQFAGSVSAADRVTDAASNTVRIDSYGIFNAPLVIPNTDKSEAFAVAKADGTTLILDVSTNGTPRTSIANGTNLEVFSDNFSTIVARIDGITGEINGKTFKATGVATAVSSGETSIGGAVSSTVGAAGGASALPATPLGYINAYVGGTSVKIPYFNA